MHRFQNFQKLTLMALVAAVLPSPSLCASEWTPEDQAIALASEFDQPLDSARWILERADYETARLVGKVHCGPNGLGFVDGWTQLPAGVQVITEGSVFRVKVDKSLTLKSLASYNEAILTAWKLTRNRAR